MAAVNIGAAARYADIAEHELQDAGCAHDRVAIGMLRLAHRPDDRAGFVLGHGFGHIAHFGFLHAGHALDFIRRPFRGFFLYLFNAINARGDIVLVLPAVLEDMVHHAHQKRDIGAGANAVILVSLGCRPGEAGIDTNYFRAVFLGMQGVQHRHGMRFRRVRAEKQYRF